MWRRSHLFKGHVPNVHYTRASVALQLSVLRCRTESTLPHLSEKNNNVAQTGNLYNSAGGSPALAVWGHCGRGRKHQTFPPPRPRLKQLKRPARLRGKEEAGAAGPSRLTRGREEKPGRTEGLGASVSRKKLVLENTLEENRKPADRTEAEHDFWTSDRRMTQISDMSASHVRKELQQQSLTAQGSGAKLHKSSHGASFNSMDTLSTASVSFPVLPLEGEGAGRAKTLEPLVAGKHIQTLEATGNNQVSGKSTETDCYTEANAPPSLKLPKRFSISKTDTQPGLPQDNTPGNMPSANGTPFPERQLYYLNALGQGSPEYHQQARALQPAYQQTFYNPQNGTLVTLPMSAPPLSYPNAVSATTAAPQPQQQPVVLMPVRPQTYYTRAANGQLVPVAVPTLSTIPAVCNMAANSQQTLQRNTTSDSTPFEETSPRKKQKTSAHPSPEIKKAEELQRQHIQRQTLLYPKLHQEVQSPNVSDIYQTNNESALAGSEDEHVEEDGVENSIKLEATNHAETCSTMGDTPIMVTGQDAEDKQPKLQKITGTVSLGAFTYKYSQTLSGDPIKDRELFDCLTDNAWKSCMAKR